MRTLLVPVVAVLACGALRADDPAAFEVASVKPSVKPPNGSQGWTMVKMSGGPGTPDPTRIDYQNVSMNNLITRAYGISHWQLSGPDWMGGENFDITAKVPAGATREQFAAMLQNLLAERFKLQVHRESKEMAMYSLTVGKSGLKLKPHVEKQPAAADEKAEPGPVKKDAEGYPILSGGMTIASSGGKARLRDSDKDIAWLIGQLSGQLGAPVSDDTGLKGHFDIELYWASGQGDDGSPDLAEAVARQLGLKLEKKKGPIETMVVDHVERVPLGN
jgi:uncharacterized protein (TIGR03435 family)